MFDRSNWARKRFGYLMGFARPVMFVDANWQKVLFDENLEELICVGSRFRYALEQNDRKRREVLRQACEELSLRESR